METKEGLQENQYHFPYHHLSHEEDGAIFIFRHLFWGLEHFTYIKFVVEQIKKHSPNTIADIGCGEGRMSTELSKIIPSESINGFDISEAAIRFANGFLPNVKFAVKDITKGKLDRTYDSAVSCEVIEHIKPEEVDAYCKNIADSLNHQGVFFLTTPTTNIPTTKKHYQHFTLELLEQYLNPYFTIEEVVYLNRVNIFSRLLNRLIANKYFLSNSKTLNRWVLQQYRKHLLLGAKNTGSRIFIKAQKKSVV